MILEVSNVRGLSDDVAAKLAELVEIYEYHYTKNQKKEKYYDGKIALRDVNLGIALPEAIKNLEVGCDWAAKAVDVLAARSMFDGFVSTNGNDIPELRTIIDKNRFISQYNTACKDELLYGCTFATLSAIKTGGCKIRFHSPQTAAAKWSGAKGRIDCGFAIIDTAQDEKDENLFSPSLINLYTDEAIWELTRTGNYWDAVEYPHKMGRPLMEAFIWNSTSKKPFGKSRIKRPVRALVDGYIRTLANAAIALEFGTSPQKYLLGITDAQYEAVVSNKFKQYIGAIIAATQNPETGENPIFGQLPQGTLQPHIEHLRMLATQFSAITGLSVTDTGVINDANPTSSDAILAQSQTLVSLAEQLNSSNGDSLKVVAQMALAITLNKSLDEIEEEQNDIIAHFKNPAMPSVSATADAALKIASARDGFAQTDTFLEMNGFSQADIRRIKAQEAKSRGQQIFSELSENENIEE